MGADAIMEYQYSVIATIRDILWCGKKAASRPEYLTIIIILGIEHNKQLVNRAPQGPFYNSKKE